MSELGSWHGWQDDNGDAMFIADGPKQPVLVRVTGGGAQEDVLAVFTSVETASLFQDWFDRSFEDTALANQQLSTALHGIPSVQYPRAEPIEQGRYPGLVEDD